MPEGVEHQGRGCAVRVVLSVQKPQMPEGVEHEQVLSGPVHALLLCKSLRCRKALSTGGSGGGGQSTAPCKSLRCRKALSTGRTSRESMRWLGCAKASDAGR